MRMLTSEEIGANKESLLLLCQELGTVELEDGQIRKVLRRYPRSNGGFYSKAHLRKVYKELADELDFSNNQEQLFLRQTQKKATRSISGVTPVTVLTKPFPCPGRCIFCPNDVRMPKSYLSAEPGAQRAIRNNFDPYAQTYNRLLAFRNIGHSTDKIELIILGGTWTSYPEEYQRWFVMRCFCALNDFIAESAKESYDPERDLPFSDELLKEIKAGRVIEKDLQVVKTEKVIPSSLCPPGGGSDGDLDEEILNLKNEPIEDLIKSVKETPSNYSAKQGEDTAVLSPAFSNYNQVVSQALFPQREQADEETASWQELGKVQRMNEAAECRCVGMSIETRPDEIDEHVVLDLRRLGATKTQIGFQSLNDVVLEKNHRGHDVETTRRAVQLLRQAGFKIQAHWMPNLYGSDVELDKIDFVKMFEDGDFMPDELKVYPCSLIETAELMAYYEAGLWQPYTYEELLEVLTFCLRQTPEYTRLSRVIRDISSDDIVRGNKITNFREVAEKSVLKQGGKLRDVRAREIRGKQVKVDDLKMRDFVYRTSVSEEHFVQWVTVDDALAGFVRVSVPFARQNRVRSTVHPDLDGAVIIRELHVYGPVVQLGDAKEGRAQHQGLGRQLLVRAEEIAREAGFGKLAVISAVGTREYYRRAGFEDGELYQVREL